MTLPSFGKDRSLREHIQGLERIAEEYQRVTGQYPGEEVMLGTLVRSLPSAIKQHVQLQMTDSSSYQSIRDYVLGPLGYEVTTTSWTPAKMHQALGVVPLPSAVEQGPVPMEVDALQRKGPKGKGKKGKEQKGKGGQQPQNPYGDKGKAKEGKQKGKKGKEHKGKGGQQPQNPGAKGSRANVVCHNCQRKGHYASECWRPRVQQVQAQGSDTASTVAPSTVGPSASQVAGSAATTTKRVARVEIDMTSSAFQDDAEISGHLCVLTKVCPEDPAAATAQPSFASLCKSLASACVDPVKPHVLVPSDGDCVWTVPDEMHGATCVGWLSSARDSEYVKCKAPARNRARPGRRSRPPLQCEPMLHTCEAAAEQLETPPVHPLQDLSVCAVSWADMSNEIEVVVDSGSDASCLPLSWAHVGRADGASLDSFRDAQGRMIRGSQMRTAVLQIDGVQFKERWLLSSVTQPLFSVGKLLRRGWDIIHSDGVPYLTNPGGTVRVPMHYRHNSLHARGSIMSVVVCANDCLSDDREDDAARHHEPQEAELDDEQVRGNDQQVEVPRSAEADSPVAAAVRALKLGSAWLNLGSQYTEMQPGIFARQDQSDRFLDVSVPLSHHGVGFRTTLQYDGAEWKLIEINCLISLFDDLEKEFEPKGSRHIITIGSVDPLQVEKLFDHQPVAWNDESYDGEYADAPPDENMLEEDEKAEDVDEGAGVGPVSLAEVPSQGHVVVNGVELHPGCTLKTLRSACEVLGIGKSGGKQTVFARIEQHLKTQELLQQHAFQTDGVPLPLEQKFVEEPTAEQKRRHELSHVPYADWCPHCVKFRAKADKHVSSKLELRDDSVCSFDFAYTGRSSPAEFEGASKDKLVCLVIKDSHTGAMHAVPTPAKGGPVAFKYLVAEVCRFLNYCGHESVTIRSDGEPACLALQQGIKAFRTKMGLRTHLEQTEPGDHQSNPSEQAIDSIRQLAGCILDQFEERAQTTVGAMHPLHGYAWRPAAWLHMRMSRHNDLSAFQVINGRPYAGKLVCFGENVYARVKSSVKGKARWCKMLWLGKLPVSDLHFGVTEGGFMLSSRSVRRLPKQYDSSLCAKLRDMPWSQASFLAGQVGQARKQKTLQGDEDAGTEPQVEQQAEVPSQAGAAENPLPFPGHLLPDDAMLQEFVPPLPREPVLHSPEPPTPVAATPGQQAETPMQVETASPLVSFDDGPGIASSSSGIARPATEEAGGEAPARKKLRLDAVQTSAYDCEMFHHDEAPELLDESAEQFLDCQDESIWDTEDWADDSANAPDIPSILIKPFSETEPVCDASELEAIDAAADSFELEQLTKAGVLEQSESWLEGHRTLSSKYVRTWRPKVINQERVWLRRARLVAREFAHLDPGRQHLFAPTTTQCMLRIVPSLFIRNFWDGWSLLSLDVSDAFLQCKQQHDTLTKVDGKWYKLFRMLPGQRDGSATWFQDFMCEIRAAVAAEPLAEQPVLFRIPHAEGNHKCQGGGMVHVDDMLSAGLTARLQELENHLKSKFKVSSEWIRQVGDEVSFLKRRLILVSPNLLVVEPDIKYLEKLLKITGLDGAKERYKAAPFPTGGLPTDLSSDRELNSESASKYRSALGILMYLASDLLACQFGIRFLSTHAHKPTEGCWKLLRHLTAYVNCHKSHVLCLAKPQLGQGLICNRVSEQKTSTLEMFSDSDWSGDKKTRKSAEYNSLVAGAATAILLKNCVIHLSLGNRQGVGRTRHIDGKLLWLQQMTQEKMLDISPVGTAENVGDLPTKPLKPERVEFILARLNVRDKDCGYALVGNAHLLDHRTRHHVSRIVKRGAVNPQLVLQILALALQADSVASADDEPNTHRDDALSQGTGEHGYGDGAWKSATTAAYPSDFAAFFARLSLSAVSELRAVADSDLIPINIPSSAEAFATECIARGAFDRASVQILFDLLPKTRPHKVTGSAEPGTAFFGGTMHQEGVTAPRSTCYTFPEAMRVINAFLRSVDPCHHYAAFVLTKNVSSEVHRDPRNAAVPNMIVAISSFSNGGIWIQDPSGTTVRSFHGSPVTGTVHSLQDGPVYLDARGCLHATQPWTGDRLIAIAYTPQHLQLLSAEDSAFLASLGFPVLDSSPAGGGGSSGILRCPRQIHLGRARQWRGWTSQGPEVGVDHAAREAFDPKTSRAFGQPMQEFVDGFGLCSPGRWAPEAREKLASSDEVAHAEKIRGLLRLLRDFVIDQLKDPKDMAFRLATGHVKKSPFAQSALQKLRQRIVDIIPGATSDLLRVPERQPFHLYFLAETMICGGTDNSSTGKLQKKGSSTKWPLMGIQMACAAALHKVNKQLTLQWRPRDENTLSDAITNHDFSSFCPELRVPLKLDDLPLDIFLRMIHSREAFVNARVSLQHLVSRETSMSRREKEQSKTPW
ncbi:unnamed protein product [Symbiodinium sp. CCMP2592]|nr:unnamed protein product [Symbiodinium sp. CCMP2592]